MSSKHSPLPCIDTAIEAGRNILLEHEVHEILHALGVRAPQQMAIQAVEAEAAARFACEWISGDLVVIKAASPDILHKSEVGGVRFVEKKPETIFATIAAMETEIHAGRYTISQVIEHDLSPGGELLLGLRWTPDFGAVVSLGTGGVTTEFLACNLREGRELAVFSPSLTCIDDIAGVLASKAFTPLVTGGVRKQRPRASLDALRSLVVRCLDFAREYMPATVSEVEINPLVPTEEGFYALDAMVRTGRPEESSAPRPIDKIANLLHAESVAVVGVSRAQNAGRVIVSNLIGDGFPRERIWIVKPNETEIDGCACVPDISSLPQAVDLLVLAIPAEHVPAAIEEVIAGRKAESVVVIPGGLGERAGSEILEKRMRESLAAARASEWRGPVINGANCLGIHSRPAKINTIFVPQRKLASSGIEAPLAIISQSGALAIALGTKLGGVAPRYVVSIGNQADLTVGDYIRYFESDGSAEVLAFYVEGFQPLDGRAWVEAAARLVSRGRTVILYRAGRTSAGADATQSHTAAIAGDYVVTRELAAEIGVLVADTLEEFADLIRMATLLRDRRPRGLRLGAMSNAGFETVAIADRATAFTLPPLTAESSDRIRAIIEANRLGQIVTIKNPLDVNPLLSDEPFATVAETLLADPEIDAAVIACVPLTGALKTLPDEIDDPGSLVNRLAAVAKTSPKPWICVIDSGPNYDAMADRLEHAGIPVFRSADRAVRVFGKWCEASRVR